MALTDLEVFQETAYNTFIEGIAQQINLFNSATRGGIVLRTAAHQGDYAEEAFFKRISGLVRRRNAYGSGAVTSDKLEHLLDRSVKVAAGTKPMDIDPGQFRWIQMNPEQAGVLIGQQMAQDSLADMLNTAILCLVAALTTEASNLYNGSAATPDLTGLNNTARLMGDRADSVRVWVLHSKSMFDIWGDSIANAEALFSYGTINVRHDGFGRIFVVTDSAALINLTPTPDEYQILGLQPGAAIVEQNNDFDDALDTTTGDENIQRQYQAEWSYNVGLKGFAWDATNGGASPTDTALGTGTNWDKHASSTKDLAGVLGYFQ